MPNVKSDGVYHWLAVRPWANYQTSLNSCSLAHTHRTTTRALQRHWGSYERYGAPGGEPNGPAAEGAASTVLLFSLFSREALVSKISPSLLPALLPSSMWTGQDWDALAAPGEAEPRFLGSPGVLILGAPRHREHRCCLRWLHQNHLGELNGQAAQPHRRRP